MKKVWALTLCLAGLVAGGLFVQAPTTANAAVHYIHKWQHPYPVGLADYDDATGKANRPGVYSSKGKLLRRFNALTGQEHHNYWPLAEAKINGHNYYRIYRYSTRANHEGGHKLVGWVRKSNFTNPPHNEYASAMFYTYEANLSDSENLPKAMWLNEIEGQPTRFQAEAGHSFSFVTSASFALRSYLRESDGNYSSTGVDAYRCTRGEMELIYSSQKKGKNYAIKYIKNGQTKHYTVKDNKYGKVPTTIKNNVYGKWLSFSYKLKGKQHNYTITNTGVTRFDGHKVTYKVESNEG